MFGRKKRSKRTPIKEHQSPPKRQPGLLISSFPLRLKWLFIEGGPNTTTQHKALFAPFLEIDSKENLVFGTHKSQIHHATAVKHFSFNQSSKKHFFSSLLIIRLAASSFRSAFLRYDSMMTLEVTLMMSSSCLLFRI